MKVTSVRILAVLLSGLVAFSATAQRKTFRGLVWDKAANSPVSMAGVRNIITGATAISHRDGSFQLEASAGNIIAITANGYYSDTLSISDSIYTAGSLSMALRPLPSTLQDVTISTFYNQYQLDSLARHRYFMQTVGEAKISTLGRPNDSKDFGIALNLDHFSKREKNKRYARTLYDIMEEEAYINYRWNQEIVNKYTQFKDEELVAFMQKARPAYAWLRSHENEEDLLYYINTQLRKYRK